LLCFWQTQRLEWKNNLIESINSNYNSVLDEFPSNDENSQYEFMNTSVKGQLLTGKKMFFYKFNLKGESGYEIVLPMQMISKKFIYVILGWIPFDSKDNFELDEVFKIWSRPDVTEIINQSGEIDNPIPLGLRLLKEVPEFRSLATKAASAVIWG